MAVGASAAVNASATIAPPSLPLPFALSPLSPCIFPTQPPPPLLPKKTNEQEVSGQVGGGPGMRICRPGAGALARGVDSRNAGPRSGRDSPGHMGRAGAAGGRGPCPALGGVQLLAGAGGGLAELGQSEACGEPGGAAPLPAPAQARRRLPSPGAWGTVVGGLLFPW